MSWTLELLGLDLFLLLDRAPLIGFLKATTKMMSLLNDSRVAKQ